MKTLAPIGLAAASLGLVGAGLWLIYPPGALLGVGLLIWLDLLLWSRQA